MQLIVWLPTPNLQKISEQCTMLRHAFDELHIYLKRYENNCTFIESIDWSGCVALLDSCKRRIGTCSTTFWVFKN